jgi:hypothetical protein
MKKFTKLLLAIGGISAVGAGLAIGTLNDKTAGIQQGKATEGSETASAIYMKMTDQTRSMTTAGKNPYVRAWNLTFVSGSGYSSINDLASGIDGVSVSGTAARFNMTWVSGNDDADKTWFVIIPWFVNSFSYQYASSNDGYLSHDNSRSVTVGDNIFDYVNSSWDTYRSTTSKGYTSSFVNYTLTLKDGSTTLTENQIKKYKMVSIDSPTVEGKACSGWYTDAALSTAYVNGTKIVGDTTLYGSYSVTAASFASWLDTQASGDSSGVTDSTTCASQYSKGLALYNQMSASEKLLFVESTYPTAFVRWSNWKAANGASSGEGLSIVDKNANDKGAIIILGGLAGLAVVAAGGYFFVRKKKSI